MRAEAAALLLLTAPLGATAQERAALYTQHCAHCHQADGGGVPYFQPPLAGAPFVTGDAETLIWFVLQGSDAVLSEDSAYENEMPGFAALSDREIAAILSHIRSSFGNQAGAVSPDAVAGVRRDYDLGERGDPD